MYICHTICIFAIYLATNIFLFFTVSAQRIEYSGSVRNESNKPIKRARIYVEAGRTDENGCFETEKKYGWAILVGLDGYANNKFSLYSDPVNRITLNKHGEWVNEVIPQALQTDFEAPLYVVNGVYVNKFKARNYTDAQIASVTTSNKWNKSLKKIFAETDIDKIDVEKRGVVVVTLKDDVTLNTKNNNGKYTILVTDSSGKPLPNAVIYTGRDRSDDQGAFSFKAKPARLAIVESSSKYESAQFTLTEQNNLDIVLQKREDDGNRKTQVMPTFRGGGVQKFREWIMDYLSAELMGMKSYYDIEVQARFTVGTSGKVVEVEIIKENNKKIAYSVKKAIYNSPRWTPGVQHGKKVKVSYIIPVRVNDNMNL